MTTHGFTLFDTAIGRCGIAWGGRGVVFVQLPEARDLDTRARVLKRLPDAREAPPPPEVQAAVGSIVALLRGEAADLSGVALDMDHVPPFHRRVYEVARTIPPGATLSYGDVAARLGTPGAARAVGQALGRNPFAIVVPCHRVLAAGGKAGGFSANGGVSTKLRLLAIEGAQPSRAPARRRGDGSGDGDITFDFDAAAAVEHVRASDAALARVIDAVGPFAMRLDRTRSLFAALTESIVYQQLTGKAAATIFARLCALFPARAGGGPTPRQILSTPDERLRGAGLSRSKLLALRDLAQRAEAGEIPSLDEVERMDDEAIIERLTAVRGVGRWTVEMLLMFRLGRPDVLPVDDYGIRKGFAIAFKKRELPSRKDLEKRGARWKPYRTVASWYLWRAVELAKK
ncbi:methylated-DNA--protein-cysteine methyltransferase [Sorangium cellulosum]|uniref:Methylated-DNA--protein-cysteine methyltransferase n=1 Tax=Sorangium cellulosum TaxID=56 RepID=A0A2L0ES65_SORCE|nr:methylated-DNA--[protein]-cysteine S-methyltransferase [Sorangium cellulosum]AUX42141.1 methylated-DNA--protein-cysteine methyltransferase [Sorangium cellulosum]